jgi:hypothetical protein
VGGPDRSGVQSHRGAELRAVVLTGGGGRGAKIDYRGAKIDYHTHTQGTGDVRTRVITATQLQRPFTSTDPPVMGLSVPTAWSCSCTTVAGAAPCRSIVVCIDGACDGFPGMASSLGTLGRLQHSHQAELGSSSSSSTPLAEAPAPSPSPPLLNRRALDTAGGGAARTVTVCPCLDSTTAQHHCPTPPHLPGRFHILNFVTRTGVTYVNLSQCGPLPRWNRPAHSPPSSTATPSRSPSWYTVKLPTALSNSSPSLWRFCTTTAPWRQRLTHTARAGGTRPPPPCACA